MSKPPTHSEVRFGFLEIEPKHCFNYMKIKTNFFFTVLTRIVGVHAAPAQVTNLGIVPAPGEQSLLYWPVSTTNYVLQTITNLSSTNWVTTRTAYAVNTAVVTNDAPAAFFQLLPTTTPPGMAKAQNKFSPFPMRLRY